MGIGLRSQIYSVSVTTNKKDALFYNLAALVAAAAASAAAAAAASPLLLIILISREARPPRAPASVLPLPRPDCRPAFGPISPKDQCKNCALSLCLRSFPSPFLTSQPGKTGLWLLSSTDKTDTKGGKGLGRSRKHRIGGAHPVFYSCLRTLLFYVEGARGTDVCRPRAPPTYVPFPNRLLFPPRLKLNPGPHDTQGTTRARPCCIRLSLLSSYVSYSASSPTHRYPTPRRRAGAAPFPNQPSGQPPPHTSADGPSSTPEPTAQEIPARPGIDRRFRSPHPPFSP